MRRKDRQITDKGDILSILDKCKVMRVAFCDGDKPYIVPLNFAAVTLEKGLVLYFHCAAKGRKLDILTRNNNVCFEVDCSFNLVPHQEPCQWSARHESVIGEGIMEMVTEPDEKIQGLNAIMVRYGFEGVPQYDPAVFERTVVLKLSVQHMAGKRNL